MNWYYVREGAQIGPIDESEFHALVSSGLIKPSTIVWREGMTQWRPYGYVASMPVGQSPNGQDRQAPYVMDYGAAPYCVECGNLYSPDEMIRYAGLNVCAGCKNIFFQRIREGAPLRMAFEYGGFWLRFGAKFMDYLILQVASLAINFGFGILFNYSPERIFNNALYFIPFLLQITFVMWYTTWFVGKYAATPGKMACGLKVITPDGGRVTYIRAFARYWAEMLSGMLLLAGYLMAAWDDEKRTLHDRICSTRVVKA